MQNWAARSHRELYEAVRRADGPAAAAARAAMPEPVEFDLDATLTRLFAAGGDADPAEAAVDLRIANERATAAHARAVSLARAALEDHDFRRSDPPVRSASGITGDAGEAGSRPGTTNSSRSSGTRTTGPAIPGSGGSPCRVVTSGRG
ncbi:hypothetical protein HNR02_006777 [Amycolatopsis endophytica]|uniref:Uncharacterized protein n=1 Tax=Amycolatopsis endophytica TaxID=860233 RepID=A0A853BFF2_9PSEU|nr:hypothetical protein [Amycolatopsis endophytica]NYI93402.1 hypothetical protein [Amycolatopsis endophytica]